MKQMKLFTLVALAMMLMTTSCTKQAAEVPQEIADHEKTAADMLAAYNVTDAVDPLDISGRYLTENEFEVYYDEYFSKAGIWPKEVWRVMTTDTAACLTKDQKEHILSTYLQRTEDTDIETIARKNSGSLSVNGGQAFWDATPNVVALTLASLNTTVDSKSAINYYNAGTSATTITMSDVLRAVNGLNNTAFDSVIEIADVVFEFPVSGNNWLIGAVVVYQGQEYVYSNFETEGLPFLGPLVYDPVEGGVAIVGPMPGGITYVSGDGWEAPIVE